MSSSIIGRKLGKYEITELLGQGGMATVYKGYQREIDRYVAVKVLPPHPGQSQQFVERFQQEARTIARLQHPHILPLYDYGVEDDILYLAMAYIEGGSLNDRIEEGGIQMREVEELLRQVASALDYAHRQGIIHRDIKPDNILLDKEGHALLADFGIAKLAEGGSQLTATGGLVGTPAYMSPEQGRGEDITGSADIYSLGVVVYELLTGQKPYKADTPMQMVLKHISDPVPHLDDVNPNIPSSLEPVIQRVLAKNPQNRYSTATEFANDFTNAIHSGDSLADFQVKFTSASPDPTVVKEAALTEAASNQIPQTIIMQQPGTSPVVLLGGIALIAVALVAVIAIVFGGGDDDAPPATVEPTIEAVAVVPSNTPQPSFGSLSFSTTDSLGDTVTLQVQNLVPPGDGLRYAAWLTNTASGETQVLGELTVDALGSGVLPPYVDADKRLLPALYNAVLLTTEESMSDTPQGEVLYSGFVPEELTGALIQIFVFSPDGLPKSAIQSSDYNVSQAAGGDTGGLLDSVLAEASRASQHAGLAQRASNVGGMHTHAEHTINILSGTQEDYDGNSRGENPGFGVGVPRFVELIEAQIDTAANAPTATRQAQANLELIRVCLDNTRFRVDNILALEQAMVESDDVAAVAPQAFEAVQIAAQLLRGFDANGNGQIEPFEDECGLEQIKTYGLLVSAMTLTEGDVLGGE